MVSYNTTALGISLAESFIVALLVTYILMPWVMKNMKKRGITGRDQNKLEEPIIPEMGGVLFAVDL